MSESSKHCEEKQRRKENIPYRITLLVLVVFLSKYAQNPQFLHCLCTGPATNRSRESSIPSRLFLCLSIGLSICSYFIILGNPTKGKMLNNIFIPQKPPILYCNIQGEKSSFQSPFLLDLWLLFVSLCVYSSCVPAQVDWMVLEHWVSSTRPLFFLSLCLETTSLVFAVLVIRSHIFSGVCIVFSWQIQHSVGQAEDWAHLVSFYQLFLPYRQAPALLVPWLLCTDVVVFLVMHAHTALERQHTCLWFRGHF